MQSGTNLWHCGGFPTTSQKTITSREVFPEEPGDPPILGICTGKTSPYSVWL